MKRIAVRNLRLCTKDCLCLYVCPYGATDTENSVIDTEKCTGCGVCADACPSKSISMAIVDYPPQQKKTERVTKAIQKLAENKAKEERIARDITAHTDDDNLRKLMKAVARSSRLVAEDLMREGGYMLPQSSNSLDLVKSLHDNPPSSAFPSVAAAEILSRIKCNDRASAEGKYRCSVCFTEFEVDEGEEAICPMCHATGEKLELL